jgi:methionyl-tRNA formyltransferase
MSGKLNVFLAGQKSFGAAVLEALLHLPNIHVVGVSCPLSPEDGLLQACPFSSLSVLPAGMLNAESLPEDVDLIVCAHAHDFIGRKTRLKARLGAIGYHPSLLPLHRGRDAVYWTIRFGDKVTGGSVYWLSDSVDAGDIAAQDWCFVRPEDTASTLWRRELFPMGVRLLVNAVQDIAHGRIVAIPQDNALSTWEPSVGRPPLPRPDVPLLGTLSGYTVIRERQALSEAG